MRLFFTSQGRTALINADGSGLRYLDFKVPDQVTWQPGPFLSDGRRRDAGVWQRRAIGIALLAFVFAGQESRAGGDETAGRYVVGPRETSQTGPRPQPAVASRLTERQRTRLVKLNGVRTLEVDGVPFLLVGAQCDIWRSTRQDEKTVAFFDGYQAMNATAVSVGVPWSKLEPAKDAYDFGFLDWFIEQARRRGLRLVVNLFNSNVCGKVQEGASPNAYPQYTPGYVLSAPDSYQRMVLPSPWKYDPGGPPMCPNDSRTLERERRLCAEVARHLDETDAQGTVILMQLDNEFYYQQWAGPRPADERSIRCQCPFCEEKWKSAAWGDGEEFMFRSFAGYVRVLTDTITAIHPLPLYVNSPWWPPRVIPVFLDECPNLALVGVDGVFSPNEPNMLSRSQVGRNVPFAAENPTENPETRINLDVLPYYSILGQLGIGNLLWECGPPHTVVEDPQARQRYGAALYPLRWAAAPIARARGTENLAGWFILRDIQSGLTTDAFGNFVPAKPEGNTLRTNRWYVREGRTSRVESTDRLALALGDLKLNVRDATAGIVVRLDSGRVLLAVPKGKIEVEGLRPVQIIRGRFERDQWRPDQTFIPEQVGEHTILNFNEPAVVQLSY